jgi:hypothetical protein
MNQYDKKYYLSSMAAAVIYVHICCAKISEPNPVD